MIEFARQTEKKMVALSLKKIIYFSVDLKVSESHVLMSAPWARGQYQGSSRRDNIFFSYYMKG